LQFQIDILTDQIEAFGIPARSGCPVLHVGREAATGAQRTVFLPPDRPPCGKRPGVIV
jgi:hypothetical protein